MIRLHGQFGALIRNGALYRANLSAGPSLKQSASACFSTSLACRYARSKSRSPRIRRDQSRKSKASKHQASASEGSEPVDMAPASDTLVSPTDGPVQGVRSSSENTKQGSPPFSSSSPWTSLQDRLQTRKTPRKASNDAEDKPETEPKQTSSKRATSTKSKKGSAKKLEKNLDVKTVRPRQLHLQPVEDDDTRPIPKLQYNLDRVLFNHGAYQMQDSRSGVFNFDPYLASIMPVEEFDFDALKDYITSSQDTKLRHLAAKHDKKYCGSTSSMTAILAHFHYLLSAWRMPNYGNLSRSLVPESLNFTALTRGPAAAFARYENGVYAIDSDKQYDNENVLSLLGKSMEKLLTLPKDDFEKYRRSRSHQLTEDEKNTEESYHYTTLGDFMMRSQLDAHDHRLPGTGVFDLKTRAVVTIRMDVQGYKKGVGYEIRKQFGQWESFEREYYDLIRAAFLKYSLQVRMGRMDGIFVAYHNTQRIFGFQYISLEEMDNAIHGTTDTKLGDQEFKASLSLLNDLLNRATERFPGRHLRLHVETRPTKVPLTYFFVEPVSEDNMRSVQEAGKPSVEQLEKEIRGLSQKEREAESAEAEAEANARSQDDDSNSLEQSADTVTSQDRQGDSAWEEMMAKVEETVENESLGVRSVREAVQDALEQSGLLGGKTEIEAEKQIDKLASLLTAQATNSRDLRVQARAEESTEDNADDGAVASEGSSEETATSQADSTQKSLKDLILKVTADVDEKTADLATLHRIFAGLSAKSETDDVGAASPESSEVNNEDNEDNEVDNDANEEAGSAASQDDAITVKDAASDGKKPELLGMYVTIRNKINGKYVGRPTGHDHNMDWSIEYAISEIPEEKAHSVYSKIKRRRKTVLAESPGGRAAEWYRMFKGRLPEMTREGVKYRQQREQQQEGKSVYVAWDKEPLPNEDENSGQDGPTA